MYFVLILLVAIAAVVIAQDPYTTAVDANGNALPAYSPARPPAIPLAVRGPYTNAWSSTAGNGTLNTNGVEYWTGSTLGWEGIITVDDISYEWLGTGSQNLPTLDNLKTAVPLTVSYDSQYSNFTFSAGPVELSANFFSPVLPKDLCRTSIPLSYLTVSSKSLDNATHNVQLYNDVNGAWISYESNASLNWAIYQGSNSVNGSSNSTVSNKHTTNTTSSIYSWIYQLEQPFEFGEESDFPQWGNFTFSSSQGSARSLSYGSGNSIDVRYKYINQLALNNYVDSSFRGHGVMEPVFAFSHDLGNVGSNGSTPVRYTLGGVHQPIMRYLTTNGVVPLQPWWNRCYGDIFSMIQYHYQDFTDSQVLAAQWEAQLKSDIDAYYAGDAPVYSNSTPSEPYPFPNGSAVDPSGEEYIFDSDNGYGFLDPNNFTGIAVPGIDEAEAYYSIVALSTRQIMGSYVLTLPPNGSSDASEPLMFQKETSSDGNVNTVDVMCKYNIQLLELHKLIRSADPAMPFFLYANPRLLRYNLLPLLANQESGFYPNDYSMHDLGASFPNATGHVEGNDEYMPVEESGNMIIMMYAYYKYSQDSSFLSDHYALLLQWSQYLIDYSLTPGVQLSTDDFAGQLVNQTNLAIKGIVGIAAMREIARAVSKPADQARFANISATYITQWESFAIDPSGKHTLLSYQWRSSYGLLYNIYPDLLLNLSIVPPSVYAMQSAWYPTISQVFGVPLDNRHSYTKSDWEMWTAATCSPSTRKLFVTSLAYWLNETTTDKAFTDLYVTEGHGGYPQDPQIEFIARPVAGGHFSLLALGRGIASA